MKKKLIAVLLCAALLFGCAVPAFAASAPGPALADVVTAVQADLNTRAGNNAAARLAVSLLGRLTESLKKAPLTVADLDAAVNEMSPLLGDVYGKLGVSAESLLKAAGSAPAFAASAGAKRAPAAKRAPDPRNFTGMAQLLSRYIFIRLDDPDDIAALIAASCDFDYVTVYGGHGTVYIRVDLEKNPEVFNYAVFRCLVEDLCARQGEEMLKNGDGETDYLMSYEHIAGELALHAMAYALSGELLRFISADQRLLSIYRSAAVADLNVDESRIPAQLLNALGVLAVNDLLYNILHAFKLI